MTVQEFVNIDKDLQTVQDISDVNIIILIYLFIKHVLFILMYLYKCKMHVSRVESLSFHMITWLPVFNVPQFIAKLVIPPNYRLHRRGRFNEGALYFYVWIEPYCKSWLSKYISCIPFYTIRDHYMEPFSEPTSLWSYSLEAANTNFILLGFDPIRDQTHDLLHSWQGCKPLYHWCIVMYRT
jgi:hypothetical protein